jgi:tetratricopeptide (TPR) repeat protein
MSGGKEMILGRAVAEHVAILTENAFVPLDVLFAVQQGSSYYNEKTKQGIFYAESWATVHYLMLGNDGMRRPQLSKYLSLLSAGKSMDDSFREAFQMDYGALEREVRDYIRGRFAWPAIQLKLRDKLEFDREMQVAKLSDAQAQYYLGDLLLHSDRLDEAEAQLQKAIALDSKFAASYASMGLLRVRQKRYEDALGFLSQAVEADSQNHMAHFYYAHMLHEVESGQGIENRDTRLALMRTHLKKSIELAPRFVESYSLLGYVALVLREELAETEAMLKNAIAYAPGRHELRLTLAQVMVLNDEEVAARSLLIPLRNLPPEDSVRHAAENMLKSIDAYIQNKQAVSEYQRRRQGADADDVLETSNEETVDERPTLARNDRLKAPADSIIETATTRPNRAAAGPRIEGFLTLVDCSRGLTLRVRLGGGFVQLHADAPSEVEFTSYTSTVSGSVPCGAIEPEIPVEITYRRGSDPRFLGMPVVVHFIEKK